MTQATGIEKIISQINSLIPLKGLGSTVTLGRLLGILCFFSTLMVFPMEQLTQNQVLKLRRSAHSLKPVVTVGNQGVTDNVLAEIDRALYDHQLVKIKLTHEDREERKSQAERILKSQKAELINRIGKTIVIFRISKKK